MIPASRSVPDLADFLTRRLRAPLPGVEAQRRFAPRPMADGWSPDWRPDTARHAAVLLLLYPGTHGPAVPLTLRRATLSSHPGQISLPGGAIDPGESVEAAALREADEEIGVDPSTVQVLGRLSTVWVAVSRFVITPVVAVASEPPAFRLHADEVETLIEGPVSHLLDRSTIAWSRRRHGGLWVDYPYFAIDNRIVWGATAMVLGEFVALFEEARS